MSRIALGSATFGLTYGIANRSGQISAAGVGNILQYAYNHGISTLDTAIAYGNSETTLGMVGVEQWNVVTKLPRALAGCNDISSWVFDSVRNSLSRLNKAKLFGLLLHRAEDMLESSGSELYKALLDCRDKGLVEKIGISIYNPSVLEAIAPRYQFDIVQAPFNVLDRRLEQSGWLKRLSEQGIEIHARSAFLQGLLLMNAPELPVKFARWNHVWAKWKNWLEEHKTCAREACLQFVLSHPEVDQVVIGIDSLAQLEEIIVSENTFAPKAPPELACTDEDLINPSRWTS